MKELKVIQDLLLMEHPKLNYKGEYSELFKLLFTLKKNYGLLDRKSLHLFRKYLFNEAKTLRKIGFIKKSSLIQMLIMMIFSFVFQYLAKNISYKILYIQLILLVIFSYINDQILKKIVLDKKRDTKGLISIITLLKSELCYKDKVQFIDFNNFNSKYFVKLKKLLDYLYEGKEVFLEFQFFLEENLSYYEEELHYYFKKVNIFKIFYLLMFFFLPYLYSLFSLGKIFT